MQTSTGWVQLVLDNYQIMNNTLNFKNISTKIIIRNLIFLINCFNISTSDLFFSTLVLIIQTNVIEGSLFLFVN